MPRKPKRPQDDPAESRRFMQLAHEVGAEQPGPEFERLLRKVAEKRKRPTPKAGSQDGS